MGLTLKKKNLKNLRNALKDFVFDLPSLSLVDGWSKFFKELPSFSIKNIDSYSLKKTAVFKVHKSQETFSSRRAAVKGEFYRICIDLFKTVRQISLLEREMCCKL